MISKENIGIEVFLAYNQKYGTLSTRVRFSIQQMLEVFFLLLSCTRNC